MNTLKTLIFSALSVFSSLVTHAQMENRFYASKDVFDWEMVNKDSVGVYLKVPIAPDRIVYLVREKKLYKLFDDRNNIIEEGSYDFTDDKTYGRVGNWTSYYINGQINASGRYMDNQPVGTWLKYYPDGKLLSVMTYEIVEVNSVKYYEMAGSYLEYHPNGKIKVDGLYKLTFDTSIKDMVMTVDPKTKKEKVVTSRGERPHGQQTGSWYYYKENGDLLKKEDFK